MKKITVCTALCAFSALAYATKDSGISTVYNTEIVLHADGKWTAKSPVTTTASNGKKVIINDNGTWQYTDASKEKSDTTVSLNDFFSGIEKGCSTNPALQTALDTLGEVDYENEATMGQYLPSKKIQVPANLQKLFATPELAQKHSDYMMIQSKISGANYYGFPVLALQQYMGTESAPGLNGFSIVLKGSMKEVEKLLNSKLKIVESCPTGVDEDGYDCDFSCQMSFLQEGDTTVLNCDFSS